MHIFLQVILHLFIKIAMDNFLLQQKYETFPQKKLFSICESYFTPLSYILKISDLIQMPHKEIKKVHFIQNYIPFNLVQTNNVKNLFMIMMNVFVFLLLNTVQMNNVNILSG